jgi:hypothetical protein
VLWSGIDDLLSGRKGKALIRECEDPDQRVQFHFTPLFSGFAELGRGLFVSVTQIIHGRIDP